MKIIVRSSSNSGLEMPQKISKHLTASAKGIEVVQRRVLEKDINNISFDYIIFVIDKKSMKDANFTFEAGFFVGRDREKVAFFSEAPPLPGFIDLPALITDVFSGATGIDSLTQQVLNADTPLRGNVQREQPEDIYAIDEIDFGFGASSPAIPEEPQDPVMSLFDTADFQLRAFMKPAQKSVDEERKTVSLSYDSKTAFHARQLVTKMEVFLEHLEKVGKGDFTVVIFLNGKQVYSRRSGPTQ